MNMKASGLVLWAGVTLIAVFDLGCASCQNDRPATSPVGGEFHTNTPLDIASLPDLQALQFKVDPYLDTAAALQAMGRNEACKFLSAAATNSDAAYTMKMAVLCRMLFTNRPGTEFRRAQVGTPALIGGTGLEDWPLEPIELVDGIPFAVAQGYRLAGRAELASSYLNYCMTNCDWSRFNYHAVTEAEKNAALQKLLGSDKWKRGLNAEERQFLSGQIQ